MCRVLIFWFVFTIFIQADTTEAKGEETESELIKSHLRTGESEKVEEWLKGLLEESSPRETQDLALYLYRLDYWVEAESVLESAVRRFPDDVQIRYVYASLLEDLGKDEEAMKHFIAIYNLPNKKKLNESNTTRRNSYFNLMERAYYRNFDLQLGSTFMTIPEAYPDLLIYSDAHLLTLSWGLGINDEVRHIFKSRVLGAPEITFDLISTKYTRDVLRSIKTSPKGKIGYDLAIHFGVTNDLNIEIHDFALDNFKDDYRLMDCAASLLILRPEADYYQKALQYHVSKIQKGIPLDINDWDTLYCALKDEANVRSDTQKKALEKVILTEIDKYQNSDPEHCAKNYFIREILIHLRDKERLLFAIEESLKHASKPREAYNPILLEWLIGAYGSSLIEFDTYRSKYVQFQFKLNKSDSKLKRTFLRELIPKIKNPVQQASVYLELNEYEKAKSILRDSIKNRKGNVEDAIKIITSLQVDDGEYEKVLKDIKTYQKLFNKEGSAYLDYCYLTLLAYCKVEIKALERYASSMSDILIEIAQDPKGSSYGQQLVKEVAQKIGNLEMVESELKKVASRKTDKKISTNQLKVPENERLKRAKSLMKAVQRKERYMKISEYKEAGNEGKAVELAVRLLKKYYRARHQLDVNRYRATNKIVDELGLRKKVDEVFLSIQAHNHNELSHIITYVSEHIGIEYLDKCIDGQNAYSVEDKEIIKSFISMSDESVFIKLARGAHVNLMRALTERSRDLWYNYHYNMCKMFVTNPLHYKGDLRKFGEHSDVLAYGRDGGIKIERISVKDSYKVEERTAMVKKMRVVLHQIGHKKKFDALIVEIQTEFEMIKKDLKKAQVGLVKGLVGSTRSRIEHKLSKLRKRLNSAFEVAIKELNPEDVCGPFLDFYIEQEELHRNFKYLYISNIEDVLGMNEFTQLVVQNDELFIGVVYELWERELKSHEHLEKIIQLFYSTLIKGSKAGTAKNVIKVFENYGCFKSGQDYSPLFILKGETSNLYNGIVSSFRLSQKEKDKLEAALLKKRDTLGGAVVGAIVINKDKEEAIEYLLSHYTAELLQLDETKFEMIISNLRLGEFKLENENKRALLLKYKNITSKKTGK